MTRFLQRLAERAMGVSRLARTVSTAPFTPAPLLAEQAGTAESRAVADKSILSTATKRQTHGGCSVAESNAERPSAGAPIVPPATRTELPDAVPSVAHEALANNRIDANPATPQVEPAPTLPQIESSAADIQDASVQVPASMAAQRMSTATPPRAVSARGDGTGGAEPASVQPLLPPISVAQPIFRIGVRGLDSPASSRKGVVEETTEVHVSIGRIEVTAVHEPAPAKPATARRPAPMSLDEYLAKRHGRRP